MLKTLAVNETENNEYDEVAAMRKRRQRQRQRRVNIGIFIAALAAAAIVITVLAVNVKNYDSLKVVEELITTDEPSSKYISYKDGYIRCSHSGVGYVDSTGSKRWDEPISFSSPEISKCADKVFVADMGGNNVYVFDESGSCGHIETPYSIYEVSGTENGSVAVMTQDSNDNYLGLYDTSAELVYSVKTTLSGDGYPLAFDVSRDGKVLALSYVKTAKKPVETGVRIYDFSSGKDSDESKISGEFSDFDGELYGEMCFFDNGNVAAVSEASLKVYSVTGKPSLMSETELFEEYDGSVKAVLKGRNKIALIISVPEGEYTQRLLVFSENGRRLCDTELEEGYDDYVMEDDRIIMTGQNRFAVYTTGGREITAQVTDMPVSAVISNGSKGRYFLVSDGKVQRVKLR